MADETAVDRHLRWQSADEEWLTRREFAELTRVSVDTAKRWARRGIGPVPHRVGPRLVRYRRSEVVAWMSGAESA